MAHFQQLKFVEITSRFFNLNNNSRLKVLEIGSYIVNETVRPYFEGSQYIGVDLMPGPGVDIVSNGEWVDLPNESFDVSVSCECFEHNPHWVKSFQNMWDLTKPNGLLIVSCASRGRFEHGTKRTFPESSPGTLSVEWNYYKNLNKKDFYDNLDITKMFSKHLFVYNNLSKDLYFVGSKQSNSVDLRSWDPLDLESQLKKINQHIPKQKSKIPRFLISVWGITRIPLYLSSWLPDRTYQNFAIRYTNVIGRLSGPIKKLFH